MNFKSCLNDCIGAFSGNAKAIETYKQYPTPSERDWSRCQKDAHDFVEENPKALDCMAMYELRLDERGIATVPVKLHGRVATTKMPSTFLFVQLAHFCSERLAVDAKLRKIMKKFAASARREGVSLEDLANLKA